VSVAVLISASTASRISEYGVGERVFSRIIRTGLVYAIEAVDVDSVVVEIVARPPWHKTAELLVHRVFWAISELDSRKRTSSTIQSISIRLRVRFTPVSATFVSRPHLQIAIPAINPKGVGLVDILSKKFLSFWIKR
jgi:hypothetical protein